jgi:hypothetical protein
MSDEIKAEIEPESLRELFTDLVKRLPSSIVSQALLNIENVGYRRRLSILALYNGDFAREVALLCISQLSEEEMIALLKLIEVGPKADIGVAEDIHTIMTEE